MHFLYHRHLNGPSCPMPLCTNAEMNCSHPSISLPYPFFVVTPYETIPCSYLRYQPHTLCFFPQLHSPSLWAIGRMGVQRWAGVNTAYSAWANSFLRTLHFTSLHKRKKYNLPNIYTLLIFKLINKIES